MKSNFISLLVGLGMIALGTSTVQAADIPPTPLDPQTQEIVEDILTKNGLSSTEIGEVLANPSDLRGMSVCTACKTIESKIGDPNSNCGKNNNAATCGFYLAHTVYNFLKGHKAAACKQATTNQAAICSASSKFGGLVGKVCSGFNCSK